MSHHRTTITRSPLRLLALLLVAVGASLAAGLTSATTSDAYWVCGPTGPVVRPADFRCQSDAYRTGIAYIEKDSSPRAYGVYRSTALGGLSVNGDEYYSGNTDYFVQDFHCLPGYANAHNRHSVSTTVQFTLAGSC